MQRSRYFERMAQGLIALVALACTANSLFMMLAPMRWYAALPTVQATGPANPHFVIDLGLAYLSSGILLAYGAWSPWVRAGALVAGTLWLALHGLVHLLGFLTRETPADRFLVDAPAVLGPPLLVILALGMARRAVRPDRSTHGSQAECEWNGSRPRR